MSYCGTYYVAQCTMYVVQTTHEKKCFLSFLWISFTPKTVAFSFTFFFFYSFVWFRQQNYSLGLMHPIKENKSTVSLIIHLTFHVHGMHTYKTFSWLFYTFFYMFKRSLLIFFTVFFLSFWSCSYLWTDIYNHTSVLIFSARKQIIPQSPRAIRCQLDKKGKTN